MEHDTGDRVGAVGDLGASVGGQRVGDVGVAGGGDRKVRSGQRRAQLAGECQGDVLFQDVTAKICAVVWTAMGGVEHDGRGCGSSCGAAGCVGCCAGMGICG